jgi:sugar phosphate isomerase/epimerase
MRLAIAIAGKNALPSAFVVYRGFEETIPRAAELGYDGVELALKNAAEIRPAALDALLKDNGLEVSCISTGQVFAETGYMFTDPDPHRRRTLKSIFTDFIDLAASYGKLVNVGRVRGRIGDDGAQKSEGRFVEMICELCDYADKRDVTLILEPVNRYEINFINSVAEGAELLRRVGHPRLKLMPDVFHMNIEDVTIGGELARHIADVAYIHFADSNRRAPGWGHTNFAEIFDHLQRAGYRGWCSVEIFPIPDPDAAASQAAAFLLPFIKASRAGA